MRPLHYLEIRNFKQFGDTQRIELDHPTVLIGPNNCGKTTAIQAMALWSQAVKTWFERKGEAPPRKRTATALNRLSIVSVPVPRTRQFWHNTVVRTGRTNIMMEITLGVLHEGDVCPVTMSFRNSGTELIYCTPDESTLENPGAIATAAGIDVRLLYPMSGIDIEEPLLQPGRIDVLLGQGQTAQVLRNLCLMVYHSDSDTWARIAQLMRRLFAIELEDPAETVRGGIALHYRQAGLREPLEVALAGRGLQQMLLILAYVHSHPPSVLLIDEPDAHLEILRQKQVYTVLREIAAENDSQVVIATHSEVVYGEALNDNLTLLLEGTAHDLAARTDLLSALRYYGTEHYVRARQRGHVLYVEGRTDLDILRALARKLRHSVAEVWDGGGGINTYYEQDNHPEPDLLSELERAEGAYGEQPQRHFGAMHGMVPGLRGLWIRDSDGREREDSREGNLTIAFWGRYEVENYIVTPDILRQFAEKALADGDSAEDLDPDVRETINRVLDDLVLERVFNGEVEDYSTWQALEPGAAMLLWDATTRTIKLSDFAEEFFRRAGEQLGLPILLRKGEFHRLVALWEPSAIPREVRGKLDLLLELTQHEDGVEV
ncbi:MAG: AAA family ATPase [Gemmatimonadota bacterium]|uniref:AAA family ATPase n=1 Tax=Candidatus Palauibacter scopulicola TaxID=3056741 RepID=UPI0023824F2B|nr:AAA family ATPase [Candidatus Palauibacter scopulicola]MDE2664298.1 AAA family ATPase [Candidatus Palauibacter scopulicola]